MKFIDGPGLLVSLPADEVRKAPPTSSLYAANELDIRFLSAAVQSAWQTVAGCCEATHRRMLIVPRPEMFTHNESLAWLRTRLGDINDHVCLSDGTAVRPIAGMRNHLFLYNRGSFAHAVAFQRLMSWVPEILASVDSQINSCIRVHTSKRTIAPPTMLLQATSPKICQPQLFATRYHKDLKLSVRRTCTAPSRDISSALKHLTYIPLTETALRSGGFMRQVAALIGVAQRTAASSVVIRLPKETLDESLGSRAQSCLGALRSAGINQTKRNTVIFATDDLAFGIIEKFAGKIDLMADASFEFWEHPKQYFSSFRKLRIYSSGPLAQQHAWNALINRAAGRTVSKGH